MLKKTSKLIGIFLILLLSFIYTDYVFKEAKKNDPLMKEVINYKKTHDKKPVKYKIKDEEVILGMSGIEVDINKSYKNMKKDGRFRKEKVVYNKIKPGGKKNTKYDYYIKRGYPKKNYVYLILKIKNGNNLDKLIKSNYFKNSNITFFVDGAFIEKNVEKVFTINNLGKEIYNLGYDGIYKRSMISVTNNLIESITLKDSIFCLNETKNEEYKNICSKKSMYSISPELINPSISDLKKNLKKGIIISYDEDNFDPDIGNIIIKLVTSRGYHIKPLSKLIKE